MSTQMVTGGTGFLGAALILEVLQQTNDDIVCLVRPGKNDITNRLEQSLHHAARLYGHGQEMVEQIRQRCRAQAADMTEDFSRFVPRQQISQFWHCAASLKYEPQHKQELYQVNIQGTRSALTLAEQCHASAFHYISTAYVSGKRTGIIYERHFEGETNNWYEETKQQAEDLVTRATHLHPRIFRPGMIIGHSKTYAANSLVGLYDLIKKFWDFKHRFADAPLNMKPLRLLVDPDISLNFMPVDMVAAQAVAIARSSSNAFIYHLTNPMPITVREYGQILATECGVPEPSYVTSPHVFTPVDRYFYQEAGFFNPYALQPKLFDRTNSDAALGFSSPDDVTGGQEQLGRYIRWYITFLKSKER